MAVPTSRETQERIALAKAKENSLHTTAVDALSEHLRTWYGPAVGRLVERESRPEKVFYTVAELEALGLLILTDKET